MRVTHCVRCGKELTPKQRYNRGKFCSRRCNGDALRIDPKLKAERRSVYLAQWRTAHQDQERERQGRERDEHPERVRAKAQRYRERHPEKSRESRQKWRAQNPDYGQQWRDANPEKTRAYGRQWAKNHPHQVADKSARRRAKIRSAPTVEKIDRLAIYHRDQGVCHLCRRKVSIKTFNLDHLVPISRGGAHTAANLRVAHPRCNFRRGADRLPAQLLFVG